MSFWKLLCPIFLFIFSISLVKAEHDNFDPSILSCDPVADSLVLVDLYYSTNEMLSWDLSTPMKTWEGVTLYEESFPNGSSCVWILNIANKNLEGSLPTTLGNFSDLRWFNFSSNKLTGTIPNSIADLTTLRGFTGNDNKISGEVPEIANLSLLQKFHMARNKLEGEIPENFVELNNINHFNIAGNFITKIPEGLVNAFPNMPANRFIVRNNYLTFESIVPNMGTKMGDFYAPQRDLKPEMIQCFEDGLSPAFDYNVEGNRYAWLRDSEVMQGAYNRDLNLLDFPLEVTTIGENIEAHHCLWVRNRRAPKLTVKVCTRCLGPVPPTTTTDDDNDGNTYETCAGSCVEIGVDDAGDCYVWGPEGLVENPNLSMIEVCPMETTDYFLSRSNDMGECTMDTFKVIVNKNFHTVEFKTDPENFCPGSQMNITATSSLATQTPSNNLPTYTYAWSTGATSQTLAVNEPGYYTVTVTSDECEVVETINIVEPQLNIYPTDLFKCGEQPLAIELDYPVEIASIDWPGGMTVDSNYYGIVPDHIYLSNEYGISVPPGNVGYAVEAIAYDGFKFVTVDGCTVEIDPFEVKQIPQHKFTIEAINSLGSPVYEICKNSTDPITIKVSPATFPNATYNYNWSEGSSNDSGIIVNGPGTYSVTITEPEYGCEFVEEIEVKEIEIDVTISAPSTILCTGTVPAPTVDLECSETAINNTYAWYKMGDQGWELQPATPLYPSHKFRATVGKYKLEFEKVNGCTASDELTIRDASDPDDIEQYFIDKGFYALPIGEVLLGKDGDPNKSMMDECDLCNEDITQTVGVCDDSGVEQISIRGENVDLETLVKTNLDYFASSGEFANSGYGYPEAKAYITSNQKVCGCDLDKQYLEEVCAKFMGQELAFWFHIYENEDGQNKLFVLSNNGAEAGINHPGLGEWAELRTSVITEIINNQNFNEDVPPNVTNNQESGFVSIPDKIVNNVMDILLDNHAHLKLPNEHLENEAMIPICNDINLDCSDNYFALAPSCCLFKLPNCVTPIFNQYLKPSLPGFALYGFTNRETNKFYRAVVIQNEFKGYYEFTKRGSKISDIPLNTSLPYPVSNPVVLTGQVVNTSGNFFMEVQQVGIKSTYLTDSIYIVADSTYCAGPIVDDSLDISCTQVIDWTPINEVNNIQDTIYDFPFVPIALNLSDISFEAIRPQGVSNKGVLLNKIIDGESVLLAVTNNADGQLAYIKWNCYLKVWESYSPPECLEHQLAAELAQETTGDPMANNRMYSKVSSAMVRELTDATGMCCTDNLLSEEYNVADDVVNAAGFNEEAINEIQNELNRVANTSSGLNVQYIFTHENTSGDCNQAAIDFENIDINNSERDVIVKLHFNASGTAQFAARFRDSMFIFKAKEGNVLEMPTEIKHLAKGAIKENINLALSTLKDSLATKTTEFCPDEDLISDPDAPCEGYEWMFGFKDDSNEFKKKFNLIMGVNELMSQTKYVVYQGQIDQGFWRLTVDPNDPNSYTLSIFDIPGGIAGFGDGLIENNPVIASIQLVKLCGVVYNDPVVMEEMIDAYLPPELMKTFHNFYAEKWETWQHPNLEVRYHGMAKDGTALVSTIYSGGPLLQLAKQKKPNKVAKHLRDEFKEFDDILLDLNAAQAKKLADLSKALKQIGGNNLVEKFNRLLRNPTMMRAFKKYANMTTEDWVILLTRIGQLAGRLAEDFDESMNEKCVDSLDNDVPLIIFNDCGVSDTVFVCKELFKDMAAGSPHYTKVIVEEPNAIDAYCILLERGVGGDYKRDAPTIKKMSDQLSATSFLTLLDPNGVLDTGRNNYRKIFINRNNFDSCVGSPPFVIHPAYTNSDGAFRFNPPCDACGNNGNYYLKKMPEVLTDYQNFVENFIITPQIDGAYGIVRQLYNGGITTIDETSHYIRVTNIPDTLFLADDVDEFDQQFDQNGSNHKFDVRLSNGDFIELKSINKKSGIKDIHKSNSSFQPGAQFGKYLSNITSISQLRYTFNKRKLLQEYVGGSDPKKYYSSIDLAKADIKNQFKKLLGAPYFTDVGDGDGNGVLIDAETSKTALFLSIMNQSLIDELEIDIDDIETYYSNLDVFLDLIINVE